LLQYDPKSHSQKKETVMRKAIALFSKAGDARAEVIRLVGEAEKAVGLPIQVGIQYLLFLPGAGVTVVLFDQNGRFLQKRLSEADGWRAESESNGIHA
jgi:hypothetical protein